MKMKKLLYIFIALSFGLVSCSDVIETPDTLPADCIMLNVYNSPMTKAQNWAGLEYERQLLRLDCFFYPKGKTNAPCVYYQKVDVNELGSAEIPFYVDESVINTIFPTSDECDVFVIANLTSGSFAKGQTGTDVPTLSKTVLTLGADRDAIDKPFIMQGLHIATKGDDNNASGTISLHRVAAKVTITVNIPEQIVIEYENADDIIMKPVLKDNENQVPFKTAFHNGVKKTYLRDDYSSQLVAADAHHVSKQNYVAVGEVPAVGDTPKKYTFTCEIPFYTYARAWEKGAEDAAYLTFEMPWTNVSDPENPVTQTYYYQILVNGGGRCFEPNNWYDLTVNVGVIGSTVESEPYTIQDLTYYVLDWTTEPDPEHATGGDRYEDVNITDYTYLIVPENRIIINNNNKGTISYKASHTIGIKMNTTDDKTVESLKNQTTKEGAYYVYCGPSSTGSAQAPEVRSAAITKNNFTDKNNGKIEYSYSIPTNIYSPVYSHITIWLDFDKDGQLDTDEKDFKEEITVVQYPPIYVIPDHSVRYSPYVNGKNKTGTGESAAIKFNYDDRNYYCLGVVPGTHNTTGDNAYMYTVSVSSLKDTDVFYYNTDNNPNGVQTPYKYIIGDPRVRKSDINLNDDGYIVGENWVLAPDYITGENRRLQYYYPTSAEDGVFQVIAPKFRIVSFSGNGYKYHNYEGAKMRCASYQEDGYPAGRWRLPTYAEMQFVIMLQQEGVIIPIFNGSSKYFSSTNQLQYEDNEFNYMDFQDASPGTINFNSGGGNGSVRCVYDEWYWGSQQDAQKNTAANPTQGKEYVFTWGDKQIWDDNGNLIY